MGSNIGCGTLIICAILVVVLVVVFVILYFTVFKLESCSSETPYDFSPISSEQCYTNGNRTCVNGATRFYIDNDIDESYLEDEVNNYSAEYYLETKDYKLYENGKWIVKSTDEFWLDIDKAPYVTLVDKENNLIATFETRLAGLPESVWRVTNYQPDTYNNWIIGAFVYISYYEIDE